MRIVKVMIKLIMVIVIIIVSAWDIKAQDSEIHKEWIGLIKQESCFLGEQRYSGENDETNPSIKPSIESGVFASKRWLDFLRRDKKEVIPFLIKQIPDIRTTQLHVCPEDYALRGELAVYCLQHILKINSYDLDSDYKKLYDKTHSVSRRYHSEQGELQKIIKSKTRINKIIKLWSSLYQLSLTSTGS